MNVIEFQPHYSIIGKRANKYNHLQITL